MTAADVKQLAQRVLELPEDASLYRVEAYKAAQALHAALGRFLATLRKVFPEDDLAALAKWRKSRGRARLHAGTGSYDTPEETWTQMRDAAIAGESLRSLSRRFGVIYDAIIRRRHADRRRGLAWPRRDDRSNVIQFPRRRSC